MTLNAPRGTKDILPTESAGWQKLESICRSLFDRYNYHEIRTPIFESTELFDRGIGEGTDIVEKEMYTFSDKGDRSMTLRPEGTASIVRAFLQHKLYAQLPQKLYYMGPMFRYERPQAGRFRQFHQIGLEQFGNNDPFCDAELIAMCVQLFETLGLKNVSININTIGCSTSRKLYAEKVKQHITPHLDALSEDDREKYHKNPLRLLDSKSKTTQTYLAGLSDMSAVLSQDSQDHFHEVINYLDEIGIQYKIDPKLVRGLDYYTETVFEVVSNDLGAQNAICGGGRYNHLVKELGGPEVPAIGCAFGVERVLSLLENIEENNGVDLYLIPLGQHQKQICFQQLLDARKAGLKCDIGLSNNLKKELKIASKLNCRYVGIFGEEEALNNLILIKDMANRTQDSIALSTLIQKVQS